MSRRPLLLYLADAGDRSRVAWGPSLAIAAERAGWEFECYYQAPRTGGHFGGGDPLDASDHAAAGSLALGGRHAELLRTLAASFAVLAVGDHRDPLWTTLDELDVECLPAAGTGAQRYLAALERLGLTVPAQAFVLDGTPQGDHGIVSAPYLAGHLLARGPESTMAVETGISEGELAELQQAGVHGFAPLGVAPQRAGRWPAPDTHPVGTGTYAQMTARLAAETVGWSQGLLLGEPDLVAAQLPRMRRHRLAAVYGRPHVDVLDALPKAVWATTRRVYGRQWDDRDFFAIGSRGCAIQLVDPATGFDALTRRDKPAWRPRRPARPAPLPATGRPATILFWCGMLREAQCVWPLIDLVGATGLRAGLVMTCETLAVLPSDVVEQIAQLHADPGPADLEILLASTGTAVAPEYLLDCDLLRRGLSQARRWAEDYLPPGLAPKGWWPLLDVAPRREDAPRIEWRDGRPVSPRRPPRPTRDTAPEHPGPHDGDWRVGRRGLAPTARAVSRALELKRPLDYLRPGLWTPAVAEAVRSAGFSYMFTKAAFGRSQPLTARADFAAVPFTAGRWGGWTPFYTSETAMDLRRAARRRRTHWVATTVDAPLLASSGEIARHGSHLDEMARYLTQSGELDNVLPAELVRRVAAAAAPPGR